MNTQSVKNMHSILIRVYLPMLRSLSLCVISGAENGG